MHIVDGFLAPPVLIAGGVLTVAGLAIGLKKLPVEKIPLAGVLSATFFIASLIHVPIGPSSVHLVMNGLAGLILGWAAFPVLFVGLLLQAVFFGFGGVTVLGVNTFNLAFPAVLVFYLCRRGCSNGSVLSRAIWGAIGGGVAIALATLFVALALSFSGDEFLPAAKLVFFTHIPVMIIEAVLAGAAVYLVSKVSPQILTLES